MPETMTTRPQEEEKHAVPTETSEPQSVMPESTQEAAEKAKEKEAAEAKNQQETNETLTKAASEFQANQVKTEVQASSAESKNFSDEERTQKIQSAFMQLSNTVKPDKN